MPHQPPPTPPNGDHAAGLTDDERIGRNVARLRGQMSQQAIADAMRERGHKWSQSTVWSVEQGNRPLRLTEAGDIADILGLSRIRSGYSLLGTSKEVEIEALARQCSELSQELHDLVERYDLARLQLALIASDELDDGHALDSGPVFAMAESWIDPEAAPARIVHRALNPEPEEDHEPGPNATIIDDTWWANLHERMRAEGLRRVRQNNLRDDS